MFKVILSYILVLVLGQFALTIGILLVSFLYAALCAFIPSFVRLKIFISFIGGTTGVLLAGLFGFAVFYFITGEYGLFPFLASLTSILIPVMNDFSKQSKLKKSYSEMSDAAKQLNTIKEATQTYVAAFYGEITGIIISICGFIVSRFL